MTTWILLLIVIVLNIICAMAHEWAKRDAERMMDDFVKEQKEPEKAKGDENNA